MYFYFFCLVLKIFYFVEILNIFKIKKNIFLFRNFLLLEMKKIIIIVFN